MPLHTKFVRQRPYSEIEIGETAELSKVVSESDILGFAGISCDFNPLHVNPEFAKTTMFGERIAHGMLSASFISAVLGTCLPGIGALYLSQMLKFTKPVRIGDTVTAKAEVVAKEDKKQILTLHTTVANQRGELVIDGEAKLMIMRDKK